MAKVMFGPIVSDARKKIGGVVFSKSKFGAYVRKKVSPVQPRTTSVRQVRANFTANSKAWSGTLDNAARLSFVQLAATLTKKDRFGQSQTLTGAQLYQSISRNLHTCGVAPLTVAPTDQAVSDIGGIVLAEVVSETSPLTGPGITVDVTNVPQNDECLVITAAAPQPAGRAFIGKGKFRIIKVFDPWPGSPAISLPEDITADYEAKFGQLVVGQTIHLAANVINTTNGAAGKPYPGSITL